MKRNVGLLAALFVMTNTETQAQRPEERFQEAQRRITQKNAVPEEVLTQDLRVIKSLVSDIGRYLAERKLPANEASAALATAWFELRKDGPPTKELGRSDFVAAVGRLGRIEIKSVPDKADITVDQDQSGKTDCALWLGTGKRRIVLSKPDYISEREERDISEGANEPLVKALQRKKRGFPEK